MKNVKSVQTIMEKSGPVVGIALFLAITLSRQRKYIPYASVLAPDLWLCWHGKLLQNKKGGIVSKTIKEIYEILKDGRPLSQKQQNMIHAIVSNALENLTKEEENECILEYHLRAITGHLNEFGDRIFKNTDLFGLQDIIDNAEQFLKQKED